jgi:putative toxin-antitoxin system antitoxin component (TIGR02293 family)
VREKTRRRFTIAESEGIARVIRVRRQLEALFTTDQAIAQWLKAPDRELRHRTPLSLLSTDLGTAKVENLIRAMIHGVPA